MTKAPEALWVQKLTLHHFRNYPHVVFEAENGPVVLTGENGVGKTNILEALSLLSPSRGLRGAKTNDLHPITAPEQPWALNFSLKSAQDDTQINIGSLDQKKVVYVNGTLTPMGHLPQFIKVLWLTPFMDQLFLEPPSKRRAFLDKLVAYYEPTHAPHLRQLDLALRERRQLLKDPSPDPTWLSILEERISHESVILIATRRQFLQELNRLTQNASSGFPKAFSTLIGPIETWLQDASALDVEGRIMETLKKNRPKDTYSNTCHLGAHVSDLYVTHLDLKRPASLCSTGEQKALLLSIIMAYARLNVYTFGQTPLVLLDEVVAHLDQRRRAHLFEEIQHLGMQAWMTGTDVALFEPLKNKGQFFNIKNG